MQIIKPQKLQRGNRVAVCSCSYPGGKLQPKRLERAREFYQTVFGLETVFLPSALKQRKDLPYLVDHPQKIAQEINQAFADTSIKAIMATTGGENTNALLKYLDYDLMIKNPKIVVGFSDLTVLILAIYAKTNLATFHGPNFSLFGCQEEPPDYTIENFSPVLFGQRKRITLSSPSFFNPSSLAIENVVTKKEVLEMPNKGWYFLRQGEARGRLLGGNLESLGHLRGTSFWPDFDQVLFFWEDVEESVASLHQWLTNLRLSGIFEKISGMIVGKIADVAQIKDEELGFSWDKRMFQRMILDVTKDYNFPILMGVDLGHTRPMLTLPIGIEARINMDGTIELLEEAVV